MDRITSIHSLSTTPRANDGDYTLGSGPTSTTVQTVPESPSQRHGCVLTKSQGSMSVRSVNDFVYDEKEILSAQGSAIYFRKLIFIKEVFYQLFLWLAAPLVILFDGGYHMAAAHCMIPFERSSGSISNTMVYSALLLSNGFWIWHNFEQAWRLEIFLLNFNFIFRAVNCSIRYGYLTRNEMKHYYAFYNYRSKNNKRRNSKLKNSNINININNKQNIAKNETNINSREVWDNVRHTLLLGGWSKFDSDTIKYECKNAELRLNWHLQSGENKKIKVECKKTNGILEININDYIKHLIYQTSWPQKHFKYIICTNITIALVIVTLLWIRTFTLDSTHSNLTTAQLTSLFVVCCLFAALALLVTCANSILSLWLLFGFFCF